MLVLDTVLMMFNLIAENGVVSKVQTFELVQICNHNSNCL